jgi:hypothetical protein
MLLKYRIVRNNYYGIWPNIDQAVNEQVLNLERQ